MADPPKAIHAAPSWLWTALVAAMLAKGYSVEATWPHSRFRKLEASKNLALLDGS